MAVAEVAEVAEWNEAPPTDEEKAIMATDPYLHWQGAPDAYAWAIEMGACKNEFEARNSFKKVVTEKFDGKFTKNNQQVVFAAVHEHWLEKLGKKLADNPFDMETLPEIPA